MIRNNFKQLQTTFFKLEAEFILSLHQNKLE